MLCCLGEKYVLRRHPQGMCFVPALYDMYDAGHNGPCSHAGVYANVPFSQLDVYALCRV